MSHKARLVFVCNAPSRRKGANPEAELISILRDVGKKNAVPFNPMDTWGKYTDVLTEQGKKTAMEALKIFFERKTFDELWLYGGELTSDMTTFVEWALEFGIKVVVDKKATEIAKAVERMEEAHKHKH